MPAVARNPRGLQILGIALALANSVLWFCPPLIGAFIDELTGRWANAPNPRIYAKGVQELLVYFDPWLARGVFPIIYIAGFAGIPFLKKPSAVQTTSQPGRVYTIVVSLLLIGFEAVWLYLIAVGVLFRDPNWNMVWPWDNWVPQRIVGLNNVNLSDYFWHWMGRPQEGMPWPVRELPGLVLAGVYLLAGTVIAYVLFQVEHRVTPYWRWLVLVLLVQFAALVPIKMVLRWAFNLKYGIFIPEYSFCV